MINMWIKYKKVEIFFYKLEEDLLDLVNKSLCLSRILSTRIGWVKNGDKETYKMNKYITNAKFPKFYLNETNENKQTNK